MIKEVKIVMAFESYLIYPPAFGQGFSQIIFRLSSVHVSLNICREGNSENSPGILFLV